MTRLLALPLLLLAAPGGPDEAEILSVERIWDAAPHNAFTDLVRHGGGWLCCFREGADHVSPDGRIRVIRSADGRAWESAALIESPGEDLRDAKFAVAPDGRLMLVFAAAREGRDGGKEHQSRVAFSEDGSAWTDPVDAADRDFWLWRVVGREGKLYGVAYSTSALRLARLYESEDGRRFASKVDPLFDRGDPSEAGLSFEPDGTLLCLLRRDGQEPTAQLGRAAPPYVDWTWQDLGKQVGGPALLRLPDGRRVAGVRLYEGKVRTALCLLDPEAGALDELLALPSGGDCSYPGLAWHEGELWVSYYSSHEGKAAIYLARVGLAAPPDASRP